MVRGFAVAAAIALCMSASPVASASVRFAYVTTKQDVNSGQDVTPAAICPAGEVPVGVGGSITGHPTDGPRIWKFELDGLDTTWTMGVHNGSPVKQTASVTSVCAKGLTPVPTHHTGILNLSGPNTNFESCVSGETLIGGGGGVDDSSSILESDGPYGTLAQTWRMHAFTPGTTHFTSTAICEANGVLKVKRVRKEVVLDVQKEKSLAVFCPSGMHVTGGGWDALDSLAFASVSKPILGRPNGWKVKVFNDGADSTVLAVNAICAR